MQKKPKVTIGDIKAYFIDLADMYCPLTEQLVYSGYQQRNGGYIDRAMREGVEVDYRKNLPSQYWHLMTYCDSRKPEQVFTKRIVCGELIFWMAEVSGAVPESELKVLADRIIKEPIGFDGERPIYDRNKWNGEIQQVCFDRIMNKIVEL